MACNFKSLLLIIVSTTVFNYQSFSQEKTDSIYGLNPVLYNGQIYAYTVSSSVEGNQYFTGSNFVNGTINAENKTFNGCLLNYDIYNQEILLKFDLHHRTVIIKLNKEKISNFTLKDKSFELIMNSDSTYTIYQAFGNGKYKALYYWYKELSLSNISGNSNYIFSKPKKKMYVQTGNEIIRFKNNRRFLSIFSKENKVKIKKYMNQHRINIKKITDTDLTQLINFCNTL